VFFGLVNKFVNNLFVRTSGEVTVFVTLAMRNSWRMNKNIVRFRRFTKPHVLRRIGRDLLSRFFDSFAEDFGAANASLPTAEVPDDDYFQAVAKVLLCPEGLPPRLNEALFAIDEMSSVEGHERLEGAIGELRGKLHLPPNYTREDFALQVWLVDPGLLARKHNEQCLRRLTAFHHFGAADRQSDAQPLIAPDPATLETLRAGIDLWFAGHGRGEATTRIELYQLDEEYWFLVRHGDSFTRTPKVENRKTGILHFRPERDDVVVYSPGHDEIRINARTKGERDLYREQFGIWLRGERDYFCQNSTYTLEPLRVDGASSLATDGLEGISRIILRELEIASDNRHCEVLVRQADNLFECHASAVEGDRLIDGGRLTRAAFDFHFADSSKPRPVQIRLPNLLRVGRHCDVSLINRWLCLRGFRIKNPSR
jgi:hypothetical protein